MTEYASSNLMRLSPLEECLARVALVNTPDDRLRLGLSAVLGAPDGSAVVVTPTSSSEEVLPAEFDMPGEFAE